VQHEHDHTDGILYLDRLEPLRRDLLSCKLQEIAAGEVKARYPMQFPS